MLPCEFSQIRCPLLATILVVLSASCSLHGGFSGGSGVLEVASQDVVITAKHAQQLAVRVSYPRGGATSYPLIVFSHGNSLSNDTYDALFDLWVSHGFVVAAPRHLDSGSREYVNQLTERVGRDWVSASRVFDVSAVIDQISSIALELPNFSGAVLTDRVIAAGHSFGALTAQLAAGATLEATGKSLYPISKRLKDSRVVAVVALSSPGEIPGVLTAASWHSLDAPHLVITGTKDTFEFLWPVHSDHFVAYESAKSGHNYLLVVEGMDHYLGKLIGRLDRENEPQNFALQIVSDVSLEFMQTYLDAEVAAVTAMTAYVASMKRPEVIRFEHR